jgi:hypothetical protein
LARSCFGLLPKRQSEFKLRQLVVWRVLNDGPSCNLAEPKTPKQC